jgi:hypothetical protein
MHKTGELVMPTVHKGIGLRRSGAMPPAATWRAGGAQWSGAGMRVKRKTGLNTDVAPDKAGVCLPRVT